MAAARRTLRLSRRSKKIQTPPLTPPLDGRGVATAGGTPQGHKPHGTPRPCRQLRGGSNWGAKRRWGEAGVGGGVSNQSLRNQGGKAFSSLIFLCHSSQNRAEYPRSFAESATMCIIATSNGKNMKHEIIELHDVQIIGMAKKIAFNEAKDECPKFWGEYVEMIIKPVFIEKKAPDAFQQAAIDNGVGEFGLCTCDIPNHNCATCWEANFGACKNKTFTYVIGGIYKGGDVPEGMQLFPIQSGKWLKIHFEGGMKAFQEQYMMFHKEWLPSHPEYKWARNSCSMEWYQGTDIQSPDYQCGVMMPLEVQPRFTFNTVGLFTNDNKAIVDFYTKAFGFITSWDGIQPNVEMFFGNNRIILYPRSAFEQMVSKKFQYPHGLNGTMELSFDVPTFADVDKEYQYALNNGAKSVLPPTTEPWGQRTCYVADPDGNLIEIGSFVE